jgi:hypothetical protein
MVSVFALLACALAAPRADASSGVPSEVEAGCEAVAVALSALAGYAVGAPFGNAASAVTIAVTQRYGQAALTASCRDYYKSLADQKDKFNYNEFVGSVCNGNPYSCPNGWNATGSIPGNPSACDFYIVCSVPFAVRSNNSLTVQDIINAGAFVDISYRSGFWEYNNFGYLVGLSGTSVSFAPR